MRLISQDGMIDVPYQRVIVSLSFICNTEIVGWWFGCSEEEVITLGNYSTEAKALKVMEMLRNKYASLELFKTTYQEGVLKSFEKEFGFDETLNSLTSIFQFPKDEEVEV